MKKQHKNVRINQRFAVNSNGQMWCSIIFCIFSNELKKINKIEFKMYEFRHYGDSKFDKLIRYINLRDHCFVLFVDFQ